MGNILKYKDLEDNIIEVDFNPDTEVILEVDSNETESAVTVKDPTSVLSTQEWVGGAKKH